MSVDDHDAVEVLGLAGLDQQRDDVHHDRRVAGSWSPVADKPLRVERWAEGTRAAIADPAGRTRVTFDPTGAADRGLDVNLTRGDARALVTLGANGEVRADAQ